jgi:hypothetical protein
LASYERLNESGFEMTCVDERGRESGTARLQADDNIIRDAAGAYLAMLAETWELTEATGQPNITAGQGRALS